MKLEIGCGHRPTPGYIHNDVNAFDGVDLVGNPWELDLPEGSLEEVLALGVIEHLTYAQAQATFDSFHKLLRPKGLFLFDVPDLEVWCDYLLNGTDLFSREHVLATLYGWQRWPGDEHKSGWTVDLIEEALAGWTLAFGVHELVWRGHCRDRMFREGDAHIYVAASR